MTSTPSTANWPPRSPWHRIFNNAPLVLALDKLPAGQGAIDLPGLMRVCRSHGLRTLAIRASRIEDIAAAIAIELPVLPPSGARERPLDPTEGEVKKTGKTAGAHGQADKDHHLPRTRRAANLRPGRRPRGDCAGESGCGTSGRWQHPCIRPDARTCPRRHQGRYQSADFCQQLTAELVSIAGQYKVSEDLRRDPLWGAGVQVSLSGDVLNIIRL